MDHCAWRIVAALHVGFLVAFASPALADPVRGTERTADAQRTERVHRVEQIEAQKAEIQRVTQRAQTIGQRAASRGDAARTSAEVAATRERSRNLQTSHEPQG